MAAAFRRNLLAAVLWLCHNGNTLETINAHAVLVQMTTAMTLND